MDAHKDYYSALGLLPDADIALIKAAYRVLAKKYHPDTAGDADEASKQKFLQIKEAYDVLSNAEKRHSYDKARNAQSQQKDDLSTAQKASGVEIDPDERWAKLVELHPGLEQTYGSLHSLSVELANSFRLSVLEAKDPSSFKGIANRLENKFLRKYFSPYRELQILARRLLSEGKREQARQLNAEIKTTKHLGLKKRKEIIRKFQADTRTEAPPNKAADGAKSAHQERRKRQSAKAKTTSRKASPTAEGKGSLRAAGRYSVAFLGMTLAVIVAAYFLASQTPQLKKAELSAEAVSDCYSALNSKQNGWDERDFAAFALARVKAKGLSVNDCRVALGLEVIADEDLQAERSKSVVSAKGTSEGRKLIYERIPVEEPNTSDGENTLSTMSVKDLCSSAVDLATSSWRKGSDPKTKAYVEEAKRRNLSVDNCLATAFGLQLPTEQRSDDVSGRKLVHDRLKGADAEKRAAKLSTFKDEQKARLADMPPLELCKAALNADRNDWSVLVKHVEEAGRRGFSVATCREKLGLSKIVELAENRLALVIGNNNYSSIPALDTAINDAREVAAALQDLGFKVSLVLDGDREAMEARLADFAKASREADTVLVYYAGHGLQHKGRNYLVPVDGQLEDETDLRYFIELKTVIDDLRRAKPKAARFLILDACRDNYALTSKFSEEAPTRSTNFGTGLAKVAAEGVLIAYATQPGKVALDTVDGKNSPFTKSLVNHIRTPGIDVRVMLARVRAEVLKATEGKQRPETSDSLVGEFQFRAE